MLNDYTKDVLGFTLHKGVAALRAKRLIPKKKTYTTYVGSGLVCSSVKKLRVSVSEGHLYSELKGSILIGLENGIVAYATPNKASLKVSIVEADSEVTTILIKESTKPLICDKYETDLVTTNGKGYNIDNVLKILSILTATNIKSPDPVELNATRAKLLAQGLFKKADELRSIMVIDLSELTNESRRHSNAKQKKGKWIKKKPFIRKGHFREQVFKNSDGSMRKDTIWVHHSMVNPEAMVPDKIFMEDD